MSGLNRARSLLLRDGHPQEALGLDVLFRELESRVSATREALAPHVAEDVREPHPSGVAAERYFDSASSAFSGSNSSESELMQ